MHSRCWSQWRVKMSVQVISFKSPNILLPNLVLWCLITSLSACKKISLLFSRSRSQQGVIWSKYDGFYYTFWTADRFATKLGLIVHYHKPEYLMEKLDWSRSQQSFKMLMNVCPDGTFWIAKPFITKFWIFTSLWARLSFKKIGLLSSRSRSQWRII